jgi:hypothetical protein
VSKPEFRIRAVPDFPAISPEAIVTFYADAIGDTEGTSYSWSCINDKNTECRSERGALFTGPENKPWQETKWKYIGKHRVLLRIVHKDGSEEVIERIQRVDSCSTILSVEFDPDDNNNELDPFTALELASKKLDLLKGIGSVMPPTSTEQKDAFEKQVKQQQDYVDGLTLVLEGVHGRLGYAVDAIHLDEESQERTPLKLWLVNTSNDDDEECSWRLVDWTNPMCRQLRGTYDGFGRTHEQAVKDVLNTWDNAWFENNNRYPDGLIQYEFVVPNYGINLKDEFETDGGTFWDESVHFLTMVSLGALATALVFAPVPGSRVAAVALWTTMISGGVASATNMIVRHNEGVKDLKEDLYDMFGVVGSLFGIGGLRFARGATVVLGNSAKSAALARGVFYGQLVNDGLQGIVLGVDYAQQFDALYDDGSLSPEERMNKTLALLSKAVLDGALTYLAVRGSKADVDALNSGNTRMPPEDLLDPNAEIKVTKPEPAYIEVDDTRKQVEMRVEEAPGSRVQEVSGAVEAQRNLLRQIRSRRCNPKTLDECVERIKEAKNRIQEYAEGIKRDGKPFIKYTDEQLLQLAQLPDDQNFLVRFMNAEYLHTYKKAKPGERANGRGELLDADGNKVIDQEYGGKLGAPIRLPEMDASTGKIKLDENGQEIWKEAGVKYWQSSFDYSEYQDSLADLIRRSVGFGTDNFDPNAKWVAIIIDKKAHQQATQAEVIIPTSRNLTQFVKASFGNKYEPAILEEILSPEYQKIYKEVQAHNSWNGGNVDFGNKRELKELLSDFFKGAKFPKSEIDKFKTRLDLEYKLGAYKEYSGFGVTELVVDSQNDLTRSLGLNQKYGVVENFILERDPKALKDMKSFIEIVELD